MANRIPKHGHQRSQGWYLRYVKADSYGAFSRSTLGPLGPGLNVIHGGNEAGKTTYASLIKGVMFGWEDGRGTRNTYKPVTGERSGTLLFCRSDNDGVKESRLFRQRNAEGVQGDRWLLNDIDKETFGEIFSLNSDQLRSMGDASLITSKLLTASSGTNVSPSQAKKELDARISEYTSRSERFPHSIKRLTAERDRLADLVADAREESDRMRHEDAQLAALIDCHSSLQSVTRELNTSIDNINVAMTTVAAMDSRVESAYVEIDALESGLDSMEQSEDYSDVPLRVINASPEERSAMVERIDGLESDVSLAELQVEAARTQYENTLSEFEASIAEAGSAEEMVRKKERSHRRNLVVIGAFSLLAVVFAALGVVLSSSINEWNVGPAFALFVGAFICMVVAVGAAIGNMVKTKKEKGGPDVKEAQWLLQRDRGRYNTALESLRQAQSSSRLQLDAMGFRQAGGDFYAARATISKAEQAKLGNASLEKSREAISKHMASLTTEIESALYVRRQQMVRCGLDPDATVDDLKSALAIAVAKREEVSEKMAEASMRIGQVEQRLEHARKDRDLDMMRMELRQVETRLEESKVQLAQLLLARRMLDEATALWQESSQPEVYRTAERLFCRMTEGRWCRIIFDDDGQLLVEDQTGERRSPLLLSTGTCQQLYLAIRIALLDTAAYVGTNIPVICDDILVNFDERRRRAAARALVQLSRSRQVIIFTCHKDVVSALRRADLTCNVIDMSRS